VNWTVWLGIVIVLLLLPAYLYVISKAVAAGKAAGLLEFLQKHTSITRHRKGDGNGAA